jgi:hypothetical protein
VPGICTELQTSSLSVNSSTVISASFFFQDKKSCFNIKIEKYKNKLGQQKKKKSAGV